MHTLVLLDGHNIQRWHGWLVAALSAVRPGTVAVHAEIGPGPAAVRPAALRLLLAAERRIGRECASAIDPISAASLEASVTTGCRPGGAFSVLLDLTGRRPRAEEGLLVIAPLFDGVPGEATLWSALLDRRVPDLALAVAGQGNVRVAAPAIEHPHQIREAADHVLSRLAEVLVRVAGGGLAALPQEPRATPGTHIEDHPGSLDALRFAWSKVADKAGRLLARRSGREPRWYVGWRMASEPAGPLTALAPLSAYTPLLDDGARYYADPFVWTHEGAHHVFVEEFPEATGRGIISQFEIRADGAASTPRPVLETGHHLSYPQIFAHEGQIYMMPECAASGALDVYRADPFPSRWVPAFRLLDAEVHDATLVAHEGRFYLLASQRAFASSSWDSLHVYSADRLEGPWAPLPGNPVLIDRTASRSAGVLYRTEEALWRPAQDCSRGYGSALTIARVTRLDRDGFAQQPAGTLRLAGAVGGPHTVNRAGRLEVLDFLA